MSLLMKTNPVLAKTICDHIRQILKKNRITEIEINEADLDQMGTILVFLNDPFKKYFYKHHTTKMKSVYAYKKAKRVIDMLTLNELHLTNLKLNEGNDQSEYAEIIQRLGYLHPFIPDDYCSSKNKCKKGNPCWFNNSSGRLPIDETREKIFIYCLTNTFNKKQHWFEYADEDAGVCVEYDFNVTNVLYDNIFTYGRIHYDNGYDFDFIKEIINSIRINHNFSFQVTGITKMAMLYKRDRYRWEDESRIAINVDSSEGQRFIQTQGIYFGNSNSQVLTVKNNNPYFSWNVRRIICGNRIDPKERAALGAICNAKNIDFTE